MPYQKRNNAIVDKSFYFGCDIVNFCKILKEQKDFKNKLAIALKEADETSYWLDIIEATIMEIPNNLKSKCDELIRLLVTIIKNS